jgi:transglutaminase-like putative cysteine protease
MAKPESLSRQQLFGLVVSVFLCSLPLFFSVSIGLLAFLIGVVYWRVRIQQTALGYPNSIVKAGLIVVVLAFIRLRFPTVFSVETFVSLFQLSFYLKFLELKSPREAARMMTGVFIALASCFLFYQTMWLALYCVVTLVVVLAAWRNLEKTRDHTVYSQLLPGAMMCLQVLPIMLVMFLVMPRLGQLWAIPSQSETGLTGFSDEMSPGSLSALIESNEVAFRVDFEGDPPPPSDRYWRGFVLDKFNGKRWSRDSNRLFSGVSPVRSNSAHPAWQLTKINDGVEYNYSVLLEPHQQQALFSLMIPERVASTQMPLGFGHSIEVLAPFRIGARMEYSVTSLTGYAAQADGLSAAMQAKLLVVPDANPRSVRYAKELAETVSSSTDFELQLTKKILSLFNESFIYTLRPPKLGDHPVDSFLFDTQRGFCEHFSSSFVLLMRAAGVPARVVVGYQGGEWNNNDQYLMVRQSDAHAWAEIWVEGRGWLRVDPTAAVSPARIERGLRDAVSSDERSLIGGWSSTNKLMSWMNHKFDALSFSWQKFVLNYDERSQKTFFTEFLGGTQGWRIALFMALSIAVLLLSYFIYQIIPNRNASRHRFDLIYEKHLHDIERLGFSRLKNETPLQFASRVANEHTELKEALIDIATCYCDARYKNIPSSFSNFEKLRKRCKQKL